MGSTKFTNPYAIEVIRTRRKELVCGISNTEDLLDLLVSNGVFLPENRVLVSSITTQEEKNSRMLNILVSRGERACRIFFYPCLKSAQPDLYQNMKTYVSQLNENIKDTRRQLIGYLLEKDRQGPMKKIQDTSRNPFNEGVEHKSKKTERHSFSDKLKNSSANPEESSNSILKAVSTGDVSLLQELIKGININDINASSGTILHLAAEHGHVSVINFLLRQGAKLDLTDRLGRTALHKASEMGHTAAVVALVKAGADIYARDRASKTPQHLAAQKGHENAVRTLVAEERRFKNQTTFLHMAAIDDDSVLADILLRNGASVDTRDGQKKTALFHAIMRGNEKTAAVLLQAGAQVDSGIVEAAFELNRKPVLSLLLRNVKTAMSRNELASILFKAVQRNLDGIVAALIESGADVNVCNDLGYTPLLLAIELGNLEVFKVLVSNKAHLDRRLPNQMSALHLAIQSGSMPITEVTILVSNPYKGTLMLYGNIFQVDKKILIWYKTSNNLCLFT